MTRQIHLGTLRDDPTGIGPPDRAPGVPPPPSAPGALLRLHGISEDIRVHNSGEMCLFRARTFDTKEPHTLRWLNRLGPDDVLYDIGANIGVYALYAAKARGCRVFAFEPEALNYCELVKNVACNGLQELVRPFMLAISNADGLTELYLSGLKVGSSCHTAGVSLGPDRKPRAVGMSQPVLMTTLDTLTSDFGLPAPTAIKVDVDGLEPEVLAGGALTLKSVRTVICELSRHLESHRQVIREMHAAGFSTSPAQWADAQRKSGPFEGVGECMFYRAEADESAGTDGETLPPDDVSAPERKAPDSDSRAPDAHFRALRPLTPSRSGPDYDFELLMALRRAPVSAAGNGATWATLDAGVFTQPTYARLREHFPALEHMAKLSDTGRVRGYDERHATILLGEGADMSRLPHAQRACWEDFVGQCLRPDCAWVGKALDMFGITSQAFKLDAMLCHDEAGYAIAPHTDRPWRLFSLLVYIPAENGESIDESIELGTTFYVPDDGIGDPRGAHWADGTRAFTPIARAEYGPNKGVIFRRSDFSYHGVARTSADRRVLIINARTKKGP